MPRVASVNLVYTLTGAQFEKGLRAALKDWPHLVALQEAGPNRDAIIERVSAEVGYAWARAEGGGVVMWKADRYRLRRCRPVVLAGVELVGHLPGRKSKLPASVATEVSLDDLASKDPDGGVTVVLNYHLTAEVQDMRGGGGYKKDPAHALRVLRHQREKYRLGKRARMHKRRGRDVYPVGDGNFDGMKLRGFVNCWKGRSGGTLGGRAVDIVFAKTKPAKLWTVETPSDHDALIVTYPG